MNDKIFHIIYDIFIVLYIFFALFGCCLKTNYNSFFLIDHTSYDYRHEVLRSLKMKKEKKLCNYKKS